MRYSDPKLVDHLASAYVLGTLSLPARRRFERLKSDRTDVALAVAQWESRLGRLAGSVQAVQPPPRVWQQIEARTRAGAAPLRPRDAAPSRGWPRLVGWGLCGAVAGLGFALAALLAAPTVFFSAEQAAMRAGERLPPSYVGLLTDAQGNAKVLVSSLRHGRTLTIKVIGPIAPPPASQQLVLWALPADAPPFVLGTVPPQGVLTLRLPGTSEQLLSRVGKLAVSVESSAAPAAPGPLLFQGNCAKLW